MAPLIPSYPAIIPELDYSGNSQTTVNKSSLKYWLLSTFFYRRVEEDEKIYFEKAFSKKRYHMPLFTMTKALAHYNDYVTSKDKKDLERFKKTAEALIKEMDDHGWKHDNLLQLPGYPPKKKNYSCLFQGRGLGVLIRYYQLKPSKGLLEKIKGVLTTFEKNSSDEGVVGKNGFFLEYSWGDDAPVVWNGHMSALVGLHDFALYGPQDLRAEAKNLLKQGLKKLVKLQKELFWRGKFLTWIRYDNNKLHFADGPYIKIETRQLEYLSRIEPGLKKTHNKMKAIKDKNKKRAELYEYYYFIKKRVIL